MGAKRLSLWVVGAVGIAFGCGHGLAQTNIILDTKSLWRIKTIWETPELVLPSGEVQHAVVQLTRPGEYFGKHMDQAKLPAGNYQVQPVAEVVRLPAETGADWMNPGFDDGTWARLRGPVLDASDNEAWKVILLRGLFEVRDPAQAGDLTLALTFRGGAVVYLNGAEIARVDMPKGALTLATPAEAYAAEVYFDAEGYAMFKKGRNPDEKANLAKRIRQLDDFRIPAAKLRKGINVLAVAIARAPTPLAFYINRPKGIGLMHDDCYWAKIGLSAIRLTAKDGSSVVPATGAQPGRGFKVWPQSTVQAVFLADYPDPFAPLNPVRLTGVRNGNFSGQVVVGDEKPIVGLKVDVSALKGPVIIPATAVQIRYARPDNAKAFDSLEDAPLDTIPVYPEHGGSVQPIWINVRIPVDAKPGDYTGTVTVRAQDMNPVAVPLAMRVIDWRIPDARDFTATMDVVQSPESVAMAYDVPLWSPPHFALLDKSFQILGEMANRTVYISCIRRTHFGNEDAMVRWFYDANDELAPDFSIAEKYLDAALKRYGTVRGVVLYCWEPPESQGHAGVRIWDKPILITVVDPQTGKLAAQQGPAWGTPEAQEFWRKLTDGAQAMLKKRGLEQAMLFGLIGDSRPTKQAMDDIGNGVPHARWATHSHLYCENWQGYEVGMITALWGIGVAPADPARGYSFGWSNPRWLAYYPREMKLQSTLVEHRVKLERWMGGLKAYTPFISKGEGPRGLGRIGGDFWPVLKDERGRVRGSLAGRYPEAAWGQLNLNYCIPYIMGRGTNGPVATVRSEAFRESIQEVEARIYVEKALLDDEAQVALGADLIGRCRKALDERIRMGLYSEGEGESWYISSDCGNRNELLFRLAGEVASKYGGQAPKPNLKNAAVKK